MRMKWKIMSMINPMSLDDLTNSSLTPLIPLLHELCFPRKIFRNFPGLLVILLLLKHANTIFRAIASFL